MDKAGKSSSVPALKSSTGWVLDAHGKAELFALVFSAKFGLPDIVPNEYSALPPELVRGGYVPVRPRRVKRVLDALDICSGTGPDGISTRIFKECSEELSLPLAKLLRRIVETDWWPTAWTIHWPMPLYNRKSVFDAVNYRAINLTAQIFKVAERSLCPHLVPALEARAFGSAQFASRKEHGCRDALAFYALSWIASLNAGLKTCLYCSDVAGAFDRVSAERLMQKLSSLNLNRQLLSVIRSWLRGRQGFVIVSGQQSSPMNLFNMVYQGTVFGPFLWNTFFGDCVGAIRGCGFEVVIYADDCNAFKAYDRTRTTEIILSDLRVCQSALHRWGQANAVIFDAGKEDFMIISNVELFGGPVKLLGISFDAKLIMHSAVHQCCVKVSWKLKTLLRVKRLYNMTDILMLYKSHILSYIEYRTPGVHFASTSVLDELDNMQSRFLREINLCEKEAFMRFNLAPLGVRRDIAISGLIRRVVLRRGPSQLWQFFVIARPEILRRSDRLRSRHNKQLQEHHRGRDLDIMRRSALGMIKVYNLLPQSVVDEPEINRFQKGLTELVRQRVIARDERWKLLLSPRWQLFNSHPLIS